MYSRSMRFKLTKERFAPLAQKKITVFAQRDGSFHIHCKTVKELGALAVLGIRERRNLAQNLVTHRH